MSEKQFNFANKDVFISKIDDLNFYEIDCTYYRMNHGDVEGVDRIFVILAPDEEYAKTWIQLKYLIGSNCNSYEDLINEIDENTIDDEEIDSTASQFIGCIDLGDYRYRALNKIVQINKERATQIINLGNYHDRNFTDEALK